MPQSPSCLSPSRQEPTHLAAGLALGRYSTPQPHFPIYALGAVTPPEDMAIHPARREGQHPIPTSTAKPMLDLTMSGLSTPLSESQFLTCGPSPPPTLCQLTNSRPSGLLLTSNLPGKLLPQGLCIYCPSTWNGLHLALPMTGFCPSLRSEFRSTLLKVPH